jgi:hypothetical protein|tara:strand:- start:348 stop:896 length:549 start_codon:yes stop_codon:yes gene_type:complete
MKDNNDITLPRMVVVLVITMLIVFLFPACTGTYYLTDSEYSDAREEHSSLTYYDSKLYWGWNEGFYYYYGTPHYYPWYYYYNICPPSHYTHTTHVIITRPVNRPTHRPNRPNRPNTHRPNIRGNNNTKVIVTPNRNTKVKTNTNYTRPKTIRVKTNRNNSNKSTNKTFNIKTNNRKNTRKPR